jgi:hypothetical protein
MGRIIPYIMENKTCLKPPTSNEYFMGISNEYLMGINGKVIRS